MALSKDQLRHAQNRLAEIERREHDEIVKSCWITDKTPPMTFEQLVTGIKNGTIKARHKSAGGGYVGKLQRARQVTVHTLVTDVYNVSVVPQRPKQDGAKFTKLNAAHRAKWAAIWDRLLLSDAPDALAIIQELEK